MSDRGKSTVVSSRSGWVGHPTTINVKGDLHIHNYPGDERQTLGETVVYGTSSMVHGAFELTVGCLHFAGTALFACLALGLWCFARVGNTLVWLEAKCGGSHKQLAYTPARLRLEQYKHKELQSGNN